MERILGMLGFQEIFVSQKRHIPVYDEERSFMRV